MSDLFGLPATTLAQLRDYFDSVKNLDKVIIYGSRASGDFHKGSDIDFAIFSSSTSDLTGKILTELDELPTPYLYDVVNYPQLKHKELKEHIDRVGIVFWQRE